MKAETPAGKAPVSLKYCVSAPPNVFIVKLLICPSVKVAPVPVPKVGAWSRKTVKSCFEMVPLLAWMVKFSTDRPSAASGVPLRVAVPSPLSTNVMPGTAPATTVSVTGRAGRPGAVVIVNVPGSPIVNVAKLSLVIVGAAVS